MHNESPGKMMILAPAAILPKKPSNNAILPMDCPMIINYAMPAGIIDKNGW